VASPEDLLTQGPVLLYDGSCGVCNQTVQWVLAHERADSKLRFAALESPAGVALRSAAHVPSDLDSLLWIESENGKVRALVRSSAALRVASEARGMWRLLGLLRVVPRFIRDFCYDAFARIRHRVIAPACLVPLPSQKARFLG
jgi:predicted DCC family thiol-disulfide oxidoreductase YuxK